MKYKFQNHQHSDNELTICLFYSDALTSTLSFCFTCWDMIKKAYLDFTKENKW